jgi:transcriptional regulator with XRE-family HTH domain
LAFPAAQVEARALSDVLVRFGQRLREIRERVGVSQEKLAELAALHRTYVSSVERGKRNISLVNIEKLARALGVSLRELMPDGKAGR